MRRYGVPGYRNKTNPLGAALAGIALSLFAPVVEDLIDRPIRHFMIGVGFVDHDGERATRIDALNRRLYRRFV